ncbi:MAG: VanZ family protein, partial [Geminicoccaceae bacterium]
IALCLLSIAYGIALEFAQAHVPNRTFDAADVIANAVGGIVGCLLALVLLEHWIGRHAQKGRPVTSTSGTSSR